MIAVKYSEMSKRNIPSTNQQGHQTHENNQTGIKPEVITQLINKMRMLIQEIKTIIKTVTENKQLSKENTNTKDSINHERQTKSNKRNPKAFSFEVACIVRSPHTSPYEETIKNPAHFNRSGHGTKPEKNRSRSTSRTRTTPTKNRFEALETEDEIPYINKTQTKKKSTLKTNPSKTCPLPRENQIPKYL